MLNRGWFGTILTGGVLALITGIVVKRRNMRTNFFTRNLGQMLPFLMMTRQRLGRVMAKIGRS
ncbi:hypothetical protein L1765_08405 [Microaerobacter geothermalis]|uniref:hypothetical protein n=1 Tax=Microaerobacter geothermalis TaxID=674972 RepID=UPI001F2E9947|nr:hypothetical protein [Microaerobacter geothermalis]MCF6093990.1 hypothetical protein [Microaerobacter geothermalis]